MTDEQPPQPEPREQVKQEQTAQQAQPLTGFNPFNAQFQGEPSFKVIVVWEPEPGLIETVEHKTWLEGLFWGVFGTDVALNVYDPNVYCRVVVYKRSLVRKVEIEQHALLDADKYLIVPFDMGDEGGEGFHQGGYV